MNKILFLDIDGVLVSFDNMHAAHAVLHENDSNDYNIIRDKYGQLYDERCVRWLEYIIKKTNAKIVISSAWKMSGLKSMQSLWYDRNLPGKVIDITPDVMNGDRGKEIQMWLDKNEVDTYCIIDDDSDILVDQKPYFVQTVSTFGLTGETANNAISILNAMKMRAD